MISSILINNTYISTKNKHKQSTKMYMHDRTVQKHTHTRIISQILVLSRKCYEKDSDDCQSYWSYLSSIENNLSTYQIHEENELKQDDAIVSNGRWDVI